MASIPPLLFPTLSFSMSALLLFLTSLRPFTNPNSNNSLIPLALHQTFSFLIHTTFLSAILLLIHHVARPHSAYSKHLLMPTRALTFVKSSFSLCIHHLTTGFTPVRSALCISTATLFLLEQSPSLFCDLSIQMLHLLLFCHFFLAIPLLYLRANTTPDGTPPVLSAGMVERLAKMTAAMSLTIVAIAVYMMMVVLVQTKVSFVNLKSEK